MPEMTESAIDEALKPLDSSVKILAWTFKEYGEDGIRQLYGEELHGCEGIASHAAQLRRLGFGKLADLLSEIAQGMPPEAFLVNPKHPWCVDRDRERAWAQWLAAHQDDERAVAWDKLWKAERNAWCRRTGNRVEWPEY